MRLRRELDTNPYVDLRKLRVRMAFRRCAGPCREETWMPSTSRQCRRCQTRTDRIRRMARCRALAVCLRLCW
jgi:hypothetical protein